MLQHARWVFWTILYLRVLVPPLQSPTLTPVPHLCVCTSPCASRVGNEMHSVVVFLFFLTVSEGVWHEPQCATANFLSLFVSLFLRKNMFSHQKNKFTSVNMCVFFFFFFIYVFYQASGSTHGKYLSVSNGRRSVMQKHFHQISFTRVACATVSGFFFSLMCWIPGALIRLNLHVGSVVARLTLGNDNQLLDIQIKKKNPQSAVARMEANHIET